jgi:hypothetical protein
MMAIATSASRPIPIIRECETDLVPFGFKPVTAAKATITAAMPRHTSQFMTERPYKKQAIPTSL